MLWSRYNIFFQREGKNFLYNSLSNSFAKLDEGCYHRLKECFSQDLYPEEDEDIVPELRRMKVLDADDQTELLRIRHLERSIRSKSSYLALTINPTLSCNFRCPYCFEKDHPVKFMSDEVEDSIVNYAAKADYAKAIDVTWFGGEPLLGFNRIKSLTTRLMNLGKDYTAGMVTNGYLLTEEIAGQLSDLKISHIQITIDGLKETHDSRRYLAGGGPTFDRIIENIRNCQRIAPEVYIAIRVNVDPTNKDGFIKVHNYIKEFDLPNVFVYPGFVSDKENSSNSECTLCNKAETIEFLIGLYREYGLKHIDFFPNYKKSVCMANSSSGIVVGP